MQIGIAVANALNHPNYAVPANLDLGSVGAGFAQSATCKPPKVLDRARCNLPRVSRSKEFVEHPETVPANARGSRQIWHGPAPISQD
jgi:hypothetical protein